MHKARTGSILMVALVTVAIMARYLDAAEKAASAEEGAPIEVAELFLEAFERKDLDTILSLFAPGALVQRARLSDGEPELAHFVAEEWAASAQQGVAEVQDFKIEILESKAVAFDQGSTVSVRFRATGKVAEDVSFVNDGVDSFSMTQMDGRWRIVLYNSVEKLDFGG